MIIIPLTQGYVTVVSDEDAEKVLPFSWSLLTGSSGNKYCIGNVNGTMILLHRHIMNAEDNELIDHKDRNGLNNQRNNLREASFSFNARNVSARRNNTSGFKGVHKQGNGWVAYVTENRRRIYLGYYESKEQAARAYDVFVLANFGEAAVTNESLGYFQQPAYRQRDINWNNIFTAENGRRYAILSYEYLQELLDAAGETLAFPPQTLLAYSN